MTDVTPGVTTMSMADLLQVRVNDSPPSTVPEKEPATPSASAVSPLNPQASPLNQTTPPPGGPGPSPPAPAMPRSAGPQPSTPAATPPPADQAGSGSVLTQTNSITDEMPDVTTMSMADLLQIPGNDSQSGLPGDGIIGNPGVPGLPGLGRPGLPSNQSATRSGGGTGQPSPALSGRRTARPQPITPAPIAPAAAGQASPGSDPAPTTPAPPGVTAELMADSTSPTNNQLIDPTMTTNATTASATNTDNTSGGGGNAAGGGSEPESIAWRPFDPHRGSNVVFVIDQSLSMKGEKSAAARREVLTTLQDFGTNKSFYILLFHSTDYDAMPAPGLLPATPQNIQSVTNWLFSAKHYYGSNPKKAMLRALDLRPDTIWLLSDGEFPADARDIIHLANASIKAQIHTVGFFSHTGEDVLRQIAEDNGGTYHFIPSPKQRLAFDRAFPVGANPTNDPRP